jgi:hypothetical protein
MEDPDDFQGQLEAFQTSMREVFEEQRLQGPLPPTPEAEALRMRARLDAEMAQIGHGLAHLDRTALLKAFIDNLEKLQEKRFYCHKSPERIRAETERAMLELERLGPPPMFRVPTNTGGTPRLDDPSAFHDQEPEAVTPRAADDEVMALEQAATEQRLKAMATPWTEFALPLAMCAKHVAGIAQADGHDSDRVHEADQLTRQLIDGCLLAPSDATMALAEKVVLLVQQLARSPSPTMRPETSLADVVTGIHTAVARIAHCSGHLAAMVHQASSPSVGLAILDTHMLELDRDQKNAGLGDAEAWQPALQELRTQASTAKRLWEAKLDGIEGRARLEFARTSKGQATCAELSRGTYHEVFIAIGRLMLDTDDEDAVQQNEMGMVAPQGSDNPKTLRGVIRQRVVRAMESRDWWQKASIELEREYGEAVSKIGQAPRKRKVPTAIGSTKSSGARPTADAIDEIAKGCLATALAAGQETGEHYIPSRSDIAKAVSKQLKIDLQVETLFGTKRHGENRVHRYPKLMDLWQQTRKQSRIAKHSKAKRSRPT